ncbi:hypothetical protein QLQ12_05490 [Actinoplanes sp. NEAU-A12]|uniref:Uncharacterized protein n=1 Tax=Actinoplanes sandaracinus TaxID=3045177 RepID=A0ABT6WE95_9ACTN|nr:hypothetical protein [Actinoplanes sandaracinus]MDI6098054.1 hypothetical protein [Actinoplanes sandaracinus]
MIPFNDPGTHAHLARHRIDAMLRDAEDHRLVRRSETERPRRRIRWPRLFRAGRTARRQPLAS